MTNLRTFALATGLALTSASLAHADSTVAGTWKLSVGTHDAPCTLSLTAGATGTAGDAVPSSDCDGGRDNITHWKAIGTGLQLYSPSGELVAWLKPKGDAYEGSLISDGRKLALNR
jgi:Protease inhibitor Inh